MIYKSLSKGCTDFLSDMWYVCLKKIGWQICYNNLIWSSTADN